MYKQSALKRSRRLRKEEEIEGKTRIRGLWTRGEELFPPGKTIHTDDRDGIRKTRLLDRLCRVLTLQSVKFRCLPHHWRWGFDWNFVALNLLIRRKLVQWTYVRIRPSRPDTLTTSLDVGDDCGEFCLGRVLALHVAVSELELVLFGTHSPLLWHGKSWQEVFGQFPWKRYSISNNVTLGFHGLER